MLIADDEPKILHGLSQQIQKMDLAIQLVGLARDGLETRDMIQAQRPDILLLDICMPFINGLEMLEELGDDYQGMKVIVITGHEEFEYAKKALELSVHSFLLKPVDIQELRSRLDQAIQELSREQSEARLRRYAADQLLKRKDFLSEVFLRDVIRDEYTPEEIRLYCGQFDIDPALHYGMTLISGVIEVSENPADELYLRYEVEGVIGGKFTLCSHSRLFSDGRGNVIWLYDRHCASNLLLRERLPELLAAKLREPLRAENAEVPAFESLPAVYDQLIALVFDSSQTSRFVADAQNYIAKAYANPDLTLVEVADVIGITPTYLSRLMKQELGLSFNKYLTKTRINHAVKLMGQGLLLKDIALRVGYSSPYYFSTAFKKTLGSAPIEYRKSGGQP